MIIRRLSSSTKPYCIRSTYGGKLLSIKSRNLLSVLSNENVKDIHIFTKQFFSLSKQNQQISPDEISLVEKVCDKDVKESEFNSDEIIKNRQSNFKLSESQTVNYTEILKDIHRASLYNQGYSIKNEDKRKGNKKNWDILFCRDAFCNYQTALEQWGGKYQAADGGNVVEDMISAEVVGQAFSALLRCNWPPKQLSERVRQLEKKIGKLGKTEMTDELSLKLLEANGKAGNVGRTLALLSYRKSYPPRYPQEFFYALKAIHSASHELRTNRSVFQGDNRQPSIDNPTRFLDAILVNMHQRDVPLDQVFAARMMETFACSGRSAKAMHAHYKVILKKPPKGSPEGTKPTISMKWNNPPPYYKVPSQISQDQLLSMPGRIEKMTKLEWECKEGYWSRALDAALSFSDSLQNGGVGGYSPIVFGIEGWNAVIKVCCHRGAIWKALQILRETMPKKKIEPDAKTYLYLLQALARLGDVQLMREIWHQMFVLEQIKPTPPLLGAMIDGLLNKSNVAGSITLCQDVWNQVRVQPPYTTHLKILEFALANSYIYEAKRHVYVLQQIWTSSQDVHPKVSKPALFHLFEYFGYELREEDFLPKFRDEK